MEEWKLELEKLHARDVLGAVTKEMIMSGYENIGELRLINSLSDEDFLQYQLLMLRRLRINNEYFIDQL